MNILTPPPDLLTSALTGALVLGPLMLIFIGILHALACHALGAARLDISDYELILVDGGKDSFWVGAYERDADADAVWTAEGKAIDVSRAISRKFGIEAKSRGVGGVMLSTIRKMRRGKYHCEYLPTEEIC